MASHSTALLRRVAVLLGSSSGVAPQGSAAALLSVRGYAAAAAAGGGSPPPFSRKDVVYNLHNSGDPEAEAAIRAFQREQFAAAAKGVPPAPAEPELELTAQVERKYAAAAVVEAGIQNIAVPLNWQASGGPAALKRYVAELTAVGEQAGFAPPAAELEYKVAAAAAGAEGLRDLLGRLKPFTSPEFHADLMEAAAAVEAETGAPVTTDGASAGYKKFADKVKALAQAHKLPWQLLLPVKQKLPGADPETADRLARDYAAWQQAAAVADAKAEIEALQAEATRLLDSQLAKSAEAVRKEQAAALAAVNRRLEAAKGSAWAEAYRRDLQYTAWYDEAVAANPASGPKAAAAS